MPGGAAGDMDGRPESWIFCRVPDLLSHPPRVVGANRFPFAPGEVVGPRANGSTHLCCVVAGSGVLQCAGDGRALRPGALAVLPWGLPWSCRDAGGLVVLSVHLRFLPWQAPDPPLRHWLPGERVPAADPAPDLGRGTIDPAPRQAFALAEAILSAWLDRGTERAFRLRALAAALVAALLPDRRARAAPPPPGVAQALEWLAWINRYDVGRDELEARAGLGRTAFGAAFKAATGRTPAAWLLERRLAEAHRLLTSGREPVAAVAARTGFGDPFHFSRCFRRRYGLSPRRARRAEPR